jgi:nondiscriminating glutamyl-tRNA synthetase
MINSDKKIRTRFAPSPTGFVHIGSLRTALFSFLYARHNGGKHVLRIEDTDQNRFVEGSMENLLNVMKTIGVEFDEGPFIENGKISQKGDYGPYIQSERKAQGLYQKYAEQLVAETKAYYCFCSEQRLEDLRKEQTALKKPPMYDRHCYNLPTEEREKLLVESKTNGKNPVIRFLIPQGQTIVHDLVFGDITYEHKVLDDQVILKSDGFPTYHLAVVVDDHNMEISHVIRGDEWIPSTPKHILLYKAFNWEPTQFAHLPLILNPDKSKLSKRQGDVAVEDFLNKGYLPEVLVNFVAFLGWNPKTEQEVFSMTELIEQFELSKINKSAAVFDINKLDWISSQYVKKLSTDELAKKLMPFWQQQGIDIAKYDLNYLRSIAGLEQERLKKFSEIGESTKYFFQTPEYDPKILIWKKSDAAGAKDSLSKLYEFLSGFEAEQFSKENLETNIKGFITDNKLDNGSVLWPLRVALTGQEKSPGPFEVCSTLALGLGKEEVLKRIQTATESLS